MKIRKIILPIAVVLIGVYLATVLLKPTASEEDDMDWSVYKNDALGLEFKHPSIYEVIEREGCNDKQGEINIALRAPGEQYEISLRHCENGLFDVPEGVGVEEWVRERFGRNYKDQGNEQYSNKSGATLNIDGLAVAHLMSKSETIPTMDEFYFVKEGKMFELFLNAGQANIENIEVADDELWQIQLLKSIRFE